MNIVIVGRIIIASDVHIMVCELCFLFPRGPLGRLNKMDGSNKFANNNLVLIENRIGLFPVVLKPNLISN